MKKLLPIFLFAITTSLFSQEETAAPKFEFRGYLKSLQTTIFTKFPPLPQSILLTNHQLHNRLNFRWFPDSHFTMVAEVRNRIFWGDLVKLQPDFVSERAQNSDDFFDLSAGYRNDKGYALHTTLDRIYAEYIEGPWEIRLGRQRVNWGISTTWNPNDIFNAFSFTDFDYEERPGSDALRVRRYTGVASSIEIAAKAFDKWEEAIGAVLAKFHTGSYDWQVLAGIAENNTVLGGGWAGNLGNASFKGEGSWFYALEDSLESSYAFTFGIDYTLSNQLYLNGSFLYNSNGTVEAAGNDFLTFELSARNLYPYRYAILGQVSYPFTPLVNGSLLAVYSPAEEQALFLNPALTVSVASNWDLDIIAQVLIQKADRYDSPVQAGFLRIKWSF